MNIKIPGKGENGLVSFYIDILYIENLKNILLKSSRPGRVEAGRASRPDLRFMLRVVFLFRTLPFCKNYLRTRENSIPRFSIIGFEA